MKNIRHYSIYALVDPSTLEVRYIGQTVQPLNVRLTKHVYKSKQVKTYCASWIQNLTNRGLRPMITELEAGEWSQDFADSREINWISRGKELGWALTNLTPGGNADSSHQLTEEYREAHSLRMKQWHKNNPDKRRKSSEYKHPPETKAQIATKQSVLWQNPVYREDQKLKIRIGQRREVARRRGWILLETSN